MPLRSTATLFENFDAAAFTDDPKSNIYSFVDALAGGSGAGNLIQQIFFTNLSAALENCYFDELDYIFGNVKFLSRTQAESYTYSPLTEQLTSDQWDEVRVKDAWFRARIKDFFAACQLGGTPEGIRRCVQAAIATECTIMEVWRYIDNFGITDALGRSGVGNLAPSTTAPGTYPGQYGPYTDNSGNAQSGYTATTYVGGDRYVTVDKITGHQVFFSSGTTANTSLAPSTTYPSSWAGRVRNSVRPRNEVVIKPHKSTLSPVEIRNLRGLLGRMLPADTIFTIDLNGLSVSTPIPISGAASDSCYYEVIKQVSPSPLVSQLPDPEYLPIDLLPTEQWLLKKPTAKLDSNGYPTGYAKHPPARGPFSDLMNIVTSVFKLDSNDNPVPTRSRPTNKQEAPYAAFMQSAQYSYYYLVGGGKRSVVDSVTYGTLQSDGTVIREINFQTYQENSSYGDWMTYDKADSPDNYPGGKFGLHPAQKPAENPDGTNYVFPYASQAAFVAETMKRVQAQGGIAEENQYKLPIQKPKTSVYTYYPEYAVANFPPTKESTISSSITRQRPRTLASNMNNPANFVR
jgi:hypothetical protein